MSRKRILVVHYSQTGQLDAVVHSLVAPLEAAGHELHYENLRPVEPYPFPWGFFRFLDVFPESVYLDPPELEPFGFDPTDSFDLVILGYQVWFLAPSLPVTGFLQSQAGRAVLAGTPVVTVAVCRNMWVMAQEKVKALLDAAGARLIDHVALVDPGPSLATFITTPRWMLTGKRGSPGGWLPPAGISREQIHDSARFGRALVDALARDGERGPGPLLHGLRAVEVDPALVASERAGERSFRIWGRLVRAAGRQGQLRRRPILALYVVFLVTLILVVVPPSLLLRRLLQPLARERLAARRRLLEQPSGSGGERMGAYLP
ncbi:MAG: dialkylresorcinol condensing enzyme [Thiohalospira sp.]